MDVGPCSVRAVSDGSFWLDGGAMFGIVPKPLWARAEEPDDENRIPLALRSLLVRVDERVILVDTGIGTAWTAREIERYRIDHGRGGLIASLEALGVAREDVTDVVLTHLHFDHAGGTVRAGKGGTPELSFPRARHHVQRRNWAHALAPTARDRGSYLQDRFSLLSGRAELNLLDGPAELAPGVDVVIFEGHTVGQQLVRVRDPRPGGRWLLYAADIVPTSAHLGAAFVMGYDLFPDVTAREKQRLIEKAAREDGVLVLEHDPRMAACTVRLDGRGRPEVAGAVTEL